MIAGVEILIPISSLSWYVDKIAIREVKAHNPARVFPSLPLFLLSSLWEASDWCTQGGKLQVDWSFQPWHARFKDFTLEGCYWRKMDNATLPDCALREHTNLWDMPLDPLESKLTKHVQRYYRSWNWESDPWRRGKDMGIATDDKANPLYEELGLGKSGGTGPGEDGIRKKLEGRKVVLANDDGVGSGRRRLMGRRGRGEMEDLRLRRPMIKGVPGWPDW